MSRSDDAQRVSRRAGQGVMGLALVLLVAHGLTLSKSCASLRPVHRGQMAPDFSLPSIDGSGELGQTLTFDDMRGTPVVLDFWATWCGPCQSSLPVLEEMSQRYGPRVRFLSVNTEGRGQRHAARRMIDQLAPSLELTVDNGQVSRLYKVSTIPQLVLIDAAGKVAWVERGFRSVSHLRGELDERIGELLESDEP